MTTVRPELKIELTDGSAANEPFNNGKKLLYSLVGTRSSRRGLPCGGQRRFAVARPDLQGGIPITQLPVGPFNTSSLTRGR
jgi:hypothetical protein